MKHTLKILIFAAMLLCSIKVWGQEQVLFQNINTALSQGDCERAQRNYNVWKDFTSNTDSSIERRIAECKDTKKDTSAATPVTVKIEPALEISTANLSFKDMGDDEKSVSVTANVSWHFSQSSGWIKTTITPDSTALKISCEPNISKSFRKDSILISAGDKGKVVIIEQNPVADPLLTGKQMMDEGKTGLAEQYFQLIVEGTNADDWNKLAKIYVDSGGEENYAKAFFLLQKSVRAKNASGMCSLGYMYEKGLGTPQNDNAAVNYYTSSALLNYAPAQYNLGLMYEYGTGVKQDMKEAVKWYEKAAKQGFKQAQEKLKK